jgi:hypothetical protein
MVTVKGRMVVNVINGRNGPFSAATLYSEIGDYVVRYDGLDQFNAGTYEGAFVVRYTCLLTRPFGVSQIIEPLAFIKDLMLDTVDECLQESLPDAIPDPAADELELRSKVPLNLVSKVSREFSHDELKQLFGEIWPLGEKVKLDPTVGRPLLRVQKNYLDASGYKFDQINHIWIKRH